MQHTNEATFKAEFQKKRFLYQGDSCFPLSPCTKEQAEKQEKDNKKKHIISKSDQLKLILRGLGHQSDFDLSFLTSQHAIQYVNELESNEADSSVSSFKTMCKKMSQNLDK